MPSSKKIKVSITLIVAVLILLVLPHLRRPTEIPATRTTELDYSFTIYDIPQNTQHVRAWIPIPLDNDYQRLEKLEVLTDCPSEVVQEPEYGNKFILLDLSKTASSLMGRATLAVKFRVTRHAIPALKQKSPTNKIIQTNLVRFLAPDQLIPIDGKIADEAYQTAGHLREPFKQARLLYDHIIKTLSYDKSGTGWGRGDATYACSVRKGNCTDFHSLFIGQARSLGIPARFIMGLPLPENQSEGIIPSYHCWGEFYLPEKGWLPIDASEAHKCPEKKDMFFGGLDENRIAFTIGRDIKLPKATVGSFNYVIYPHVEIDFIPHENVQTTFYFMDYQPNKR